MMTITNSVMATASIVEAGVPGGGIGEPVVLLSGLVWDLVDEA